ncbi:translation initiation factor eIF-2B alpha/beta/delta subunit family protein [Sediminispirochaeta smaragdinae]|uniref:EIF-2B alpha/beta/delta-related uncharacterized protein n=1 Tax=Sediminispirochaeta smaragdinae (strain DSM 11293 / JCM 15392 / SEBR 4228) TaxID=573413 RepID=E1R903_SEDSS|nr:eIF-2B alpha/beta/delta-like protein [Sediminispirochaeta smaragdinae]ADK82972.1 eIF-2B alpha/beta/delta-related uncharacterized protein [Sediminispirochaeta smaragdinae DSM 11293]
MRHLSDYMPFILKKENIARIEGDEVLIGNRSLYPFEKSFFRCRETEDVAWAIEKMVTQGGGPVRAAMQAMLLLAKRMDEGRLPRDPARFAQAKERLEKTRPTNTTMARVLELMVSAIQESLGKGACCGERAGAFIATYESRYEERAFAMADIGSSLIDDGDGVLTMCFAETSFILTIALAMEQGKRIKVYTPETRPYLQGARLTAPCLEEIGADVTLITDNMPAYLMSQGKIQKYMTAVDIAVSDGWVANKIGTYQNAISAAFHGIPYFPFSGDPDMRKVGRDSIIIERRDPEEVKHLRGLATTTDTMKAYYPAFDIVPPHLIAGIITPKGLISPYLLKRVYGEGESAL